MVGDKSVAVTILLLSPAHFGLQTHRPDLLREVFMGKLATWEKLLRNKRNMCHDSQSTSINLPCMFPLILFFRLEPRIRSSLIHQAFIKFTRCTIVHPSSDRWEFQEQGPIFPCKTSLGPWFDRSFECSGNTELWQVWAMELQGCEMMRRRRRMVVVVVVQ